MKVEYIEKIFKKLMDEFPSFCDFLETESRGDFNVFLDKYCTTYKDYGDIKINSGATKGVIIVRNDFVIKLPFNDDYDIDYIGLEYNNYMAAVANGVQDFFSPCEIIDFKIDYKDIYYKNKILVMDYAFVDVDINNNYISQSNLSDNDEYDNDQLDIIRIFSNYYDDDVIISLLEFIKDYEINDFHSSNIGRLDDYTPILIDYSGYMGE